jgi:putative phosphoribosyl transferase
MYADRREAGLVLGESCVRLREDHPVVLALPRGGVPVAVEVARALAAPWDVLVVHKIGAPGQSEFAIGAVGEGGVELREPSSCAAFDPSEVDRVARAEAREIERRVQSYRRGRPLIELAGRVVVLVDDGLATGSTMTAAVRVVSALGAGRVVAAAPVGSRQAVDAVSRMAEVICPLIPAPFIAVGLHYETFEQVSDDEVIALLARR